MSRIGKLPISIPAGVTVTLKDDVVTVKGPKGEMSQYVNPAINVTIEDGHVVLAENENAMLDTRNKTIVSLHIFSHLSRVNSNCSIEIRKQYNQHCKNQIIPKACMISQCTYETTCIIYI